MPSNIVPFGKQPPAPENQAVPESLVAPPWTATRRQLYKLLEEDQSEDRLFTIDAAALILGPGNIGPTQPMSCDTGILYITGERRKYLQRAYRAFSAFYKAYYGRDPVLLESFTPDELRTYRLVFIWERARKAYKSHRQRLKNLRQNKKVG